VGVGEGGMETERGRRKKGGGEGKDGRKRETEREGQRE
jgi:hypothetical protein